MSLVAVTSLRRTRSPTTIVPSTISPAPVTNADLESIDRGARRARPASARCRSRRGSSAVRFARERREDRDAECAADLLRRVEQARGQAGILRSTFVVAISVIGTNTNPSPKPITIRPGRTSGRYEPVAGASDSSTSPTAATSVPASVTAAHPEAGDQALREPRRRDHATGQRQEAEAGLDRRHVQHVLQVERREEEHREHAAGDDEHRCVRSAQRAGAEDVESHQRMRRAQLDHDERDDAAPRRPAISAEGPPGAPAVLLGLDDAVHEQHQPTGHGRGAGEVESPAAVYARLRQDPGGDRDRRRSRPAG